ncbi:DUF4911 domain-containing protein [Desulfobulbus sp.]|uniref:DUF4911 domain-containing protein n=1 Tax=Desulfobulbus sp. TaxID=895 RepID=UPI00286EF0D8|nr:DUF4911 domain-containing protein [Desulfobulbus sp.]
MPVVVEWFLLIRPEKISWLRFILEGYDGLAILSTLAVERGLVRIQTLDCNMAATMRLLEELAEQLSLFSSQSSNDRTLVL